MAKKKEEVEEVKEVEVTSPSANKVERTLTERQLNVLLFPFRAN